MMQMLGAGGMPLLTDYERKPDIDNPRGYLEWEPLKLLGRQPERIDQAEGRAVKVISELLFRLPSGRDYRLIFMERPLPEVIASQNKMLARRDAGELLPEEQVARALRDHLRELREWLEQKEEIRICRIGYRKLLQDPAGSAKAVRDFLEINLDLDAMVRQVDPELYRNRDKPKSA